MSFEDSETLAYALSVATESSLISVLQKWEDHRKERLQRVLDLKKIIHKDEVAEPELVIASCKRVVHLGNSKI